MKTERLARGRAKVVNRLSSVWARVRRHLHPYWGSKGIRRSLFPLAQLLPLIAFLLVWVVPANTITLWHWIRDAHPASVVMAALLIPFALLYGLGWLLSIYFEQRPMLARYAEAWLSKIVSRLWNRYIRSDER